MESFRIEFGSFEEDTIAGRFIFRITGATTSFPVLITMENILRATSRMTNDELGKTMLPFGLDRIQTMVRAGNYSKEYTGRVTEIVLTQEDLTEQSAAALLKKQCLFQTRPQEGLICQIRWGRDYLEGRTTPSLCAKCSMPDKRLLCTNLMHPRISATETSSGMSRTVWSAMCEKDEDPGDTSNCIPGGKNCWEQVLEIRKSPVVIPSDLADRVADEIDFLNLSFREKYRLERLIRVSQARTVSALFGVCVSEEDFMYRVAAVSDLIDKLSVDTLLDKNTIAGLEGSLNKLEAFVNKEYPGFAHDIVTPLRHIVTLRNSFPIHSRSEDLLESFEALGIEWPIVDWQGALSKVLHTLWISLRELRRLAQSNS